MDMKKRFTIKLLACYILIVLFVLWARPTSKLLLITIPLIVFGEWIRIWGTGHLRKNEAVITSGPYAYLRDPLYLGTLSILSGFCLAGRVYELFIALWLTFFVYYMPYKRKREGNRLSIKFGKVYDDYRAEVRSLIPRSSPYKGTDSDKRWSAALVYDNSEIGTAVSAIIFYIILVLKLIWFPSFIFPSWHLF